MSLTLSRLRIYPIKSCRGHDVPSATLDDFGLAGDRRFMVVRRDDGGFVTQRVEPVMATIVPRWRDGGLDVSAPGREPLRVELPRRESPRRAVRVWNDTVEAQPCGEPAAAWFSAVLGREVELVFMADDTRRPVDRGEPTDRVSFADGFPLLLATSASLGELNRRLTAPVPIERFRPNLVLDGAEPFAEDDWRALAIGGLQFLVVKPCARCVVTTLDPETGELRGPDPLQTLGTFRKRDGKVLFATNLIHRSRGRLEVGMPATAS